MTLWVDLDETIRAIANVTYTSYPIVYGQLIDGSTFIQYVDQHPILLRVAPPTEYLSVINKLKSIRILSAQPTNWRVESSIWLERNLSIPYHTIFVNDCNEKLEYLRKGDWLIDDSPQFSNYDQIILIDRPFNQHIECENRVKTPYDLEKMINCKNYIVT